MAGGGIGRGRRRGGRAFSCDSSTGAARSLNAWQCSPEGLALPESPLRVSPMPQEKALPLRHLITAMAKERAGRRRECPPERLALPESPLRVSPMPQEKALPPRHLITAMAGERAGSLRAAMAKERAGRRRECPPEGEAA